MNKYSAKQIAGFLIPSIIGIIIFMIPIQVDGTWTIVVKVIADIIGNALGDLLPILCLIIVTVSAILGVMSLRHPSFITSYPIIDETFTTTPIWAIIRVVGCVFIWIVYLGVGFDAEGVGDGSIIGMIAAHVFMDLASDAGKINTFVQDYLVVIVGASSFMVCMGIVGFLAGILFRKGFLRRSRVSLCIFGALSAILIYGGIMNAASALMWSNTFSWKIALPYYISGFPMDCVHAAATWIFLWFAAEPMLEKLDRIKVKYGLVE